MLDANVSRVLELIGPRDVVLDIGGWARPFNRANYVIDAEPYHTRGYYGAQMPAQGGDREQFTFDTWIQRDICEHTPFPFADKQVDFVICSHTLEDIRDPLFVCAEMLRVAKRGYIEVPSRVVESCRGVEPGQVGWSHHRWLIDIQGQDIRFLMKYHMIHTQRRFSLPRSFLRRLPEVRHVQWLFWDGSFSFHEATIHGLDNIAAELSGFVERIHPYPAWLLSLDRIGRKARGFATRVASGLERRANGR
jgi:hypothetical protein